MRLASLPQIDAGDAEPGTLCNFCDRQTALEASIAEVAG
jgi:hypothetical protein